MSAIHSPPISFSLRQEDKGSYDPFLRLQELLEDVHAVKFLADLAYIAHVWDDLVDKDVEVSPIQITRAFSLSVLGFNANPFFRAHVDRLLPVLETGILNWLGANQLEKVGTNHCLQVAHVIRCSVGDVAVACASVIHGFDKAAEMAAELRMIMQQDSLEDYIADFGAAE